MEYLKEYASNIIIISVISIIFETIVPKGSYQKYVKTVIGLVVMLVIIEPISEIVISRSDFSFEAAFKAEEYNSSFSNRLIAEGFERDLSEVIKENVKSNLNKDITCDVKVSKDENNLISSIESIQIKPYSEEAAEYIERNFGVSRGTVR